MKLKAAAASAVLLALVLAPAPLLPPHRLAESVQTAIGMEWKPSYLVAALALQIAFYGSLGLIAVGSVKRAPTRRGRWLQLILVPIAVVGVTLLVRSLKLGQFPVAANTLIPIAACLLGSVVGLAGLYQSWKVWLGLALTVLSLVLWLFPNGASTEVSRDAESRLRHLVAVGPSLAHGDARFGALLQAAFAPAEQKNSVEHNRAAILAFGIAIGHERLARFVDLDPKGALVAAATALRQGATLRGRDDWARHYAVSAALAVLEHPLLSDASGVMKEEVDALTKDSGFSFGDLAADRAGVRFALAATRSEADAQSFAARLQRGFAVDDFLPPIADLPENLTTQQLRSVYGGVGGQRYRTQVNEIEARLDDCPALSVYK